MQLLDITMNMMSLGGVAMGVGMIVDNSIVVLENIFHYRSDGYNIYDSCTQGTGEVALSISASTLTTVVVFLPIGLSEGIVGMLLSDFCLTICTLMLASLVVALTIVPLLSYELLGKRKNIQELSEAMDAAGKSRKKVGFGKKLDAWYRKQLAYFITHRGKAMLVSGAMVAVFAVSIFAAGFELIPAIDQNVVAVSIGLPVGSEVEEAERVAEKVTEIAMNTVPEIDSIYYSAESGSASVTLNLVESGDRQRGAEEIAVQLRNDIQDIAGAKLSVSSAGMMDMSAMTGSAISVKLSGNDNDALEETAERLVQAFSEIPDAAEVRSSAAGRVPEVDITLKRDVATQYGLTAATVGSAVRSQLTGTTATTVKMNGEEISVNVRGDSDAGKSLDALKSLPIPTPLGSSLPLGMIADVEVTLAPQSIRRENQSRTITVSGISVSGDSTAIAKEVTKVLETFPVPEGIHIDQGGENTEIIAAFEDLGYALVVALGLVFFVLASQFESFLMPVIIMMILPVGLIGSLFLLPFFGMKVSILAFVGVIMLAGVVVNSSIVLVDYIKIRRGRGEEKNQAILNACPRRVRPVLMTTLTTILGLIPMAVGNGAGVEIMKPMALVMITGLIISTVVTLLFTPVYYSLLDSVDERMRRRKKRGGEPLCQE